MTFLLDRRHWLDEHGQAWVSAGVLTSTQLDAICELEGRETRSAPAAGEPSISLAAELLLYLAAALVGTGSWFVVSRFWERLGVPGQLAIAVAVSLGGYLAAAALGRVAVGLGRPAAVVRLVGSAGIGLSAAVLVRWLGAEDEGVIAVAVGSSVMVAGSLDWRNRERSAAFVTTIVGLAVTVGGAVGLLDPEPLVPGAIIWAASAMLLTLALLDQVHPATLASIVASVGAFIGVTAINADAGRLGIMVVLANSAALVGVGLAARSNAVLAIGLAQFTLTLPQAMGAYLHGLGAALGMLLAGAMILIVLVPRLVRRAESPEGHEGAHRS